MPKRLRFKLNVSAYPRKRVGKAHVDHILKPFCITRGPNKLKPTFCHLRICFSVAAVYFRKQA